MIIISNSTQHTGPGLELLFRNRSIKLSGPGKLLDMKFDVIKIKQLRGKKQ